MNFRLRSPTFVQAKIDTWAYEPIARYNFLEHSARIRQTSLLVLSSLFSSRFMWRNNFSVNYRCGLPCKARVNIMMKNASIATPRAHKKRKERTLSGLVATRPSLCPCFMNSTQIYSRDPSKTALPSMSKRQPSHEMLLRILLISRKNSPFPAWKHVWLNWRAPTETGRGKESVWLGLQIRQEGTNIQVSSLTPSKTVRIFQPLWIFFTSVDFLKGTLVFAYLPVIKVK